VVQGIAFSPTMHQRAARQDDLDDEIARGCAPEHSTINAKRCEVSPTGIRLGAERLARSSTA